MNMFKTFLCKLLPKLYKDKSVTTILTQKLNPNNLNTEGVDFSKMEFNKAPHLLCAYLSTLVYKGMDVVEQELSKHTAKLLGFYSHPLLDTQVFVASRDNVVYVVCRGSESAQDWLVDLSAVIVPLVIQGKSLGGVHAGFLSAGNVVNTDVMLEIRDAKTVVVTGHSLGGALSTLLALETKVRFPDKDVSHFSYGCPRVGNQLFVDAYRNSGLAKVERYIHGDDIVTKVPPSTAGFVHVDDGISVGQPGNDLTDHFIAHYVKAISDIVAKE